jgi:hypothetical protein
VPERIRLYLRGAVPPSPYQHASGLRALALGWIAAAEPGMAMSLHAANMPKPYSISPMFVERGVFGEGETERRRDGESGPEGRAHRDGMNPAASMPSAALRGADRRRHDDATDGCSPPGGSRPGRSPAAGSRPPEARDEPGRVAAEVALLADWAGAALKAGLPAAGTELRLGGQRFEFDGWESVAGWGWRSLAATAPFLEASFRLLSPTAHHLSGPIRKSAVLPDPALYFGSWLNRWNLYAPPEMRLGHGLLELVRERVAVAACAGQTESVPLDEGRVFTGFVGEVQFRLLKAAGVPDGGRRALGALARFAEYAGTGVETMRGMGQTVWVSGCVGEWVSG